MRIILALIVSAFIATGLAAQQESSQDKPSEKPKPAAATDKKEKKDKKEPPAAAPDKSAEKPAEPAKSDGEATDKEEHYDVSEVAPVVTITRSR